MMKLNKYLNPGLIANTAFVVFAYWLLAVRNGYMLRWYDEMSLFEPTRIFFRQFLYYPGGLLRYAGTWLTQLLYYPWLGASALIALWLILAWLIRKGLRLSDSAAPLALLVPIAMLVSVVQLDEAWISMKSAGYVFSNTLGYIFSSIMVLLFRKSTSQPILAVTVAAISALCYPFAGFYALLAAAICSILEICTAIKEKNLLHIATAGVVICLIAIIPQIYYTYFHGNTVDNDYLYLKGLPELTMEAFDLYLWMPFIIATSIMLIIALLSGSGWLKDSRFLKCISILAVGCGFIWGLNASRKSEQLRATVLMLQRLDRNDWQGMNAVMSRIKQPPSYTMRILNNLALVHLGQKGESMADYSPAPGDGRHSEKFTMTALVQVPLYHNIGRLNQSYRWAMEHTVQYGKRVFFLKYMVKDALLRGEIKLAKRYNDILLSTMFHRKWAEDMERYIENPSLIDSNPGFQFILKLGESEKRQESKDDTAEIH
ncbi:MAG: hypothetical protein K2N25_09140 [Muribaculaceae bacterium]|nr:hypothetical protein [Muribaculaceae bacterium]